MKKHLLLNLLVLTTLFLFNAGQSVASTTTSTPPNVSIRCNLTLEEGHRYSDIFYIQITNYSGSNGLIRGTMKVTCEKDNTTIETDIKGVEKVEVHTNTWKKELSDMLATAFINSKSVEAEAKLSENKI